MFYAKKDASVLELDGRRILLRWKYWSHRSFFPSSSMKTKVSIVQEDKAERKKVCK